MPLVSIITPAYKAEAFIASTVRSVLAQDFANWELLLVSDDHKDYQAILANEGICDPRIVFCTTGDVQSGPSRARNIGLAKAKGDVIVLLDADDTVSPNYLSLMAPAALEHGMTQSRLMQRYMEEGHDIAASTAMKAGSNPPTSILNYSTQVNLAARRDLIDFPWREDIHFSEDGLFSLQLADRVASVYYEPQAVYYYHIRRGSASSGRHHVSSILTCKQYIRSLITKSEIKLQNDLLKQSFLNHYAHSIALESEYSRALEQDELLSFADFVINYKQRS